MPKKHQVGIYLENVQDVTEALRDSREAGFDFICCGIVTGEYRELALRGEEQDSTEPFSWFDMALHGTDWNHSVTGVLSDLQHCTESNETLLRERACKLIEKELGYAQHLAMYSTMVKLHKGETGNLSRLLNSKVSNDGGNHSNILLWVRMPMAYGTSDKVMNGDINDDVDEGQYEEENPSDTSWNTWNIFRTASNSERRIMPVLDIPLDLPSDEEIRRWLGEPVKAIFINTEMFITNHKGYPILPKRTQKMIHDFFDIGSQVIINCAPTKTPGDYIHYKQYIEYLYGLRLKVWEEDPIIKFTKGYEDYLQSPLQPLMDNLESNTYEVFERDPTKYQLYQDAIGKALLFKVPEAEKDTKTIVAMVVGAGRGPLVRNCLSAADNVQRNVKVYAVEKNVNAVCTLLHLKKEVWGDRVTVISCDMREWEPKEKADILISELLGSFGDNELSPECLDGAQKFLKDDGIMIPANYTSFISPIMSARLHTDVKTFYDMNKHMLSAFETPYVVYMKNFYEIAGPKPLFTFAHPKSNPAAPNDRYTATEFIAKQDAVLHGMAGYFESQLFQNVLMSIHPDTHSEGMFSWFPIFFPIRDPIQVKKGDKVKIHFWRCSNRHNVWYEWSITSPNPTYIHNANGRSYTIGL